MAKSNIKIVHCRYPKCNKLHETTELKKEDAVQGGSKGNYYHPDCYHMMQTVNQIRDTFIKEVNSALTRQQIGALVSTIYNIVFTKGIDIDFIKFALDYFIKYKPGSLRQPYGLHYIIQNKDVISAWNKEKDRKIRKELKQQAAEMQDNDKEESIDFSESSFKYVPQKSHGFADIFG